MSLIQRFQQFHLFEDGDIFEDRGRNGVERINAEQFWKRIPEAARLALAKAAPKYAGPWTQSPEDWAPPELDWSQNPGTHQVGWFDRKRPTLSKSEAIVTPPAFAEVLLSLARHSRQARAA